jgi:hypothetical protein
MAVSLKWLTRKFDVFWLISTVSQTIVGSSLGFAVSPSLAMPLGPTGVITFRRQVQRSPVDWSRLGSYLRLLPLYHMCGHFAAA